MPLDFFFLEVLSKTTGKKIGTLRCRGLKPPAVRGHAAAFRYWFNAFGHSGPYKESIVEAEGQQKLVATGNPMNAPGNCHITHFFSRDIMSTFTGFKSIIVCEDNSQVNLKSLQFGVVTCSLPTTTSSETVTYLTAQYH